MREIIRRNIDNAKMKSKALYDRRANESVFQVGDPVFLLREKREHKLMSEYKGAYIIADLPGRNNVLLEDECGNRFLKHLDKIKLAYLSDSELNEPN